MAFREWVHAGGRVFTRALLHPRWRDYAPIASAYVGLYLFGKRLTESREVTTLRSLVRPGMVIADIGANVGFYTRQMAEWVGPAGRILAFEPDPFIFGQLERRARRGRWSNIELHRIALGDSSGRATLYSSAYNRADNRLAPSHVEPHVEAHDVEVRSLDEFLAARGTSRVDAIKIDVQGSEGQVLRGARQTLVNGVQWIWVEFSPDHLRGSGTDPERLLEQLEALGLTLFEVTDQGTLEPVVDYRQQTEKVGRDYCDLVAIPKSAAPRGDHPSA